MHHDQFFLICIVKPLNIALVSHLSMGPTNAEDFGDQLKWVTNKVQSRGFIETKIFAYGDRKLVAH